LRGGRDECEKKKKKGRLAFRGKEKKGLADILDIEKKEGRGILRRKKREITTARDTNQKGENKETSVFFLWRKKRKKNRRIEIREGGKEKGVDTPVL